MKNQIKVLIAPNSFKECADSVEISTLMKASFNKYIPDSLKPLIQFINHLLPTAATVFLKYARTRSDSKTSFRSITRIR
jgi:hypothetical protein